MKNFKDETILELSKLFQGLNERHALKSEEYSKYYMLMKEYDEGRYEERKIEEAAFEPKKYSNCVVYRDKEDGEVIVRAYPDDRADDMMRDVSKVECFSDCDDTIEILHVVFNGREVVYVGWQPNMKYEYKFVETGDVAWCSWFPCWEH